MENDREGLSKMRKAIKAIHNSGNGWFVSLKFQNQSSLVSYQSIHLFFFTAHTDNEMYLSRILERLGDNSINGDHEPEIGAAFVKFAVVTKELSALMKTLVSLYICTI